MEEIDLKELISMFLEKKLLIILVVIIFALIGAIYTLKFITPLYVSTSTIILTQTTSNSSSGESIAITQSDINLNANLVENYKEIAESRTVAAMVIQNLGLNTTIDAIKSGTTVLTSNQSEVIQIKVTNVDPELACDIANELANVLIEKALEYYKVDNANILDEAVVSLTPVNVNLFKNIIIFAFVGGILVSGYILLINMLDTTIKTDADIEKVLNLPVLASIVLTDDSVKKKKHKSTKKKSIQTFENNNMRTSQSISNLSNANNYKEKKDNNVSMHTYSNDVKEDVGSERYYNTRSNLSINRKDDK